MNIWYTKGLSNMADAMELLRNGYGGSISLIASHSRPDSPVRHVADRFLLEPELDDGYPDWVLRLAQEMDVDLVIAQRNPEAFWAWRDAFETAGIQLRLPASPDALRQINHKDLFGMALENLGLPAPAFEVFKSCEEFDEAVLMMTEDGLAPNGFCVKPAVGINGSGFRILRTEGADMDRLLNNSFFEISLSRFRDMLSETPLEQDMMLMRFLPGAERSVDFLSQDGEVLTGVSRLKHGASQTLEMEGPALEYAASLSRAFGLNGICNMQTREDADGNQHILEINPRMSGGIGMSCLSGINLPAWDVALALDLRSADEIPHPPGGLVVREEYRAEILGREGGAA